VSPRRRKRFRHRAVLLRRRLLWRRLLRSARPPSAPFVQSARWLVVTALLVRGASVRRLGPLVGALFRQRSWHCRAPLAQRALPGSVFFRKA
jgi:hypothetical protein